LRHRGGRPEEKGLLRAATFDAIAPYTKGFYVNALAAEDAAQRIRTTYGANYERLVALKRKYDPANFFQRNTNIPPG
jgi:hypothetical protein